MSLKDAQARLMAPTDTPLGTRINYLGLVGLAAGVDTGVILSLAWPKLAPLLELTKLGTPDQLAFWVPAAIGLVAGVGTFATKALKTALGKDQSPNYDYSRSTKLIKFAAKAGLAIATVKAIQQLEKNAIEYYKTETAKAIYKYLGLTPNQATLDWSNMGWHALNKLHLEAAETAPNPVIIGEMTGQFLTAGLVANNNEVVNLINLYLFGSGGTKKQTKTSNEALQELKAQNVSYVATDANVNVLDQDKSNHFPYNLTFISTIGAIFGLAHIFIDAKQSLQGKKKISAKDIIRTAVKSSLNIGNAISAGLPLGIAANAVQTSLLADGQITSKPGSLNNQTTKLAAKSEVALEKIIGSQDIFMHHNEAINHFRNLGMALNICQTISTAPKNKLTSFIVLGAEAHSQVAEFFLNGPDWLEKKIRNYAGTLAQDVPSTLAKMIADKEIDINKAMELLIGYMAMFSQPELMGPADLFNSSSINQVSIHSPASILLEEIRSHPHNDQLTRKLVNSALIAYLNTQLYTRKALNKAEKSDYPGLKRDFPLLNLTEAMHEIPLNDQLDAASISNQQYLMNTPGLISGFVRSGKRILPLEVDFYYNQESQVITVNRQIITQEAYEIHCGLADFKPTTGFPARKTALVFSAPNEHNQLFDGRIIQLGDQPEPNVTYFTPPDGSFAGIEVIGIRKFP